MKVKATHPLSVHGKLFPAGAVLDLEDGIAAKWLPLGFVEKAEEEKPRKTAKKPAKK